MGSRFKCSIDDYSMLQRLWEDLIVLKVGHRKAEERCQFYLEAENIELTKLASGANRIFFKEIIAMEKEIEKRERLLF